MAQKKGVGLAVARDMSTSVSMKSHPSKNGATAVTSKSSYAQKPFKGNSAKGKGC